MIALMDMEACFRTFQPVETAIKLLDTPRKLKIGSRNISFRGATQKTFEEAFNNYVLKTLASDPNSGIRLGALI